MNESPRCGSRRIFFLVLSLTLPLASGFSFFLCADAARAADALGYSFEAGLDGYGPNGGGITVTQDTIGATQGTQSMKVAVVAGATFVGSITGTLDTTTLGNTAIVGDPPGLDHVTFDLTIPERFGKRIDPLGPDPPFSGFAVIGVTVFGASQPDYPGGQQFGLQAQYQASEFHIDGLEAGTYHDVRIALTDALTHPLTFAEHQSFNDIFGTVGSGANDVIPTGFQLYINKSGNSSTYNHAVTAYFDNIRFGTTPPGVPGDYNGNGTVDAADYVLWRNGGPLQNEVANPGTVTPADYTEWRARFGNTSGSGSSLAAVPEPGSALLLLAAGACWWGSRARRKTR